MVMRRHALTDEQWQRLQAVIPAQKKGPRSKIGDREFIDAVLYRAKTGVPWRDLPERFGPWKSVYNRFANWSRRGIWKQIYKALRVRVDKTGCIVDGSVVRAHQDAAGGKGGSTQTVWVVVEEASPRSSTSSPTARADRSM
jgi:transposase